MKRIFFLLFFLVVTSFSFAELGGGKFETREVSGAEANSIWQGAEFLWLKQENTIPSFIRFRNGSEPDESTFLAIAKRLNHLPAAYDFILLSAEKDELGWEHKRYQLTINNIPVTNGIFLLHLVNGKVKKYNGYLFKNVVIPSSPTVDEQTALNYALSDANAQTYKWQLPGADEQIKEVTGDPNATYYPHGKLEIVQIGGNTSNVFKLAWKFDIYSEKPLARNDVFVDAHTGEILLKNSKIYNANANGTAVTVYRGNRPIVADSYNGQYRLYETTRGNGIHTRNLQTGTSTAAAVEFLDADNFWNNVNTAKDQYAGDAHWAGEMTYDFYKSMGRNSVNNNGLALNLYVHYDVAYLNAAWDGIEMIFGDGSQGYKPLVSLDITGHEISHGLDQYTANLTYQGESGALNESFSDIFGTAVEWFADSTKGNWTIAEDVGPYFRNMANPNSTGDPDTYQGTNWYTGAGDYGGVHTNSNVQNFWDYLLAQGGTGTNDKGNAYNVPGISRHKATQIAWRNEVFYLTSSADYADSRQYSIESAADLFGNCSQEVASTTKAWYAVGVGANYVAGVTAQFTGSPTTGCVAPTVVNFTNTSSNGSSYFWTFGDGTTSTDANPIHTYNTLGVYTVKLVANGGVCGSDSVTKTNYINISTSNACAVILPANGTYQTQTSCNGTLYDNGGPTGNYGDLTNSVITIAPTGASQVKLHFTQFAMEKDNDYLYVYDGNNINSPLLAKLTTTQPASIPADITSTGSSITIRQSSDNFVNDVGFTIQWSCVIPNSPPTPNFIADVTKTCTGSVKFTDISTGGPTAWLWTFGDGATSTLQNPVHQYASNGQFTVSLKATNGFGNNTATKLNYISINKPAAPAANGATHCGATSLRLTTTSGNRATWYDSTGAVVSRNDTFTTPVLSTTTTYWLEDTLLQPVYKVGPANNTYVPNGGYFTPPDQQHNWSLLFNVNKKCTLVSVYVYAQSNGYRTIQYRDAFGGVIAQRTVNCPAGGSRITLNFNLTPGTAYQLGVKDTGNFYRNNPTSTPYPFQDANGMVSITGNNVDVALNAPANYYYFYDWEVREEDCISQRAPVTASVAANFSLAITPASLPTCFGYSDGTAGLNINGGTPTYTYHWSNGQTGAVATNLPGGAVNVTVTDGTGCSVTATKTISQPTTISPGATVTPVTCNGTSTGAINLNASGGTPGYTYNWGNNITSQNRTGLPAGTYTVTVTDAALCTAVTSKTLADPPLLAPVATPTDVKCNGGNTGSINLLVTGGTPGYKFNWGNNITSKNRTNLTAGTYTVTVTDTALCTAVISKTISQPAAITPVATLTDVNCNGGNTGAINLSVTGGTPNYTFNWGNNVTSQNRTGLTAGTYTVTVTDAALCTITFSKIIGEATAITPVAVPANVTCNGGNNGSISLTVTGGKPGYTFNWGNNITLQNRTNLTAGTYAVTITDTANCTSVVTKTISEPTAITPVVTPANVTCHGGNNGSITLNVTGGTPGYTFNWGNNITSQNRSGLTEGTYSVTITDAANCTLLATRTLTEPTAIAPVATATNVSCNGGNNGSIDLAVTGGTPGYTYNWGSSILSQNRTGLVAGTYTVTVIDAASCTTSATKTISEPDKLLIALTQTAAKCSLFVGTIADNVTGGNSGYKYLWNTTDTTANLTGLAAGNYSVTVTDLLNCTSTNNIIVSDTLGLLTHHAFSNVSCFGANDGTGQVSVTTGTPPFHYLWNNGDTLASVLNLPPGSYSITTIDSNQCHGIDTFSITQPPALVFALNITPPTCNGFNNGKALASISGGTPGYTFNWSTPALADSITNLPPGAYSLTITDAVHCSVDTSFVITDPQTLKFTYSVLGGSCFGGGSGKIILKTTGGTTPYTYSWDSGQHTDTLGNLKSGTYNVTITDNEHCSVTTSVAVNIPDQFRIDINTTDAASGQNNGTASITTHGGTQPYTFKWSNGDTTETVSNLSPGSYIVTVTDKNGCLQVGSAEIHTVSGITGLDSDLSFNIYPNPASTEVIIETGSSDTETSFSLRNVVGQAIISEPLTGTKTKVDLTLIPAGMYMVELRKGERKITRQLVIVR